MSGPSLTIVCCVESGMLESMVVRMVRSLRRFGGTFSACPVLAVNARFGPPLASATRKAFDELGVDYLHLNRPRRYAWYHFLNKPVALAAVERERVSSEQIAFIDSDVVFLGEPTELSLRDDEDFAACPTDNGVIGTTGPLSPHEMHWSRICEVLGMRLESLPWVRTHVGDERIRLYLNSGVMVYRRSTQLGRDYLDGCLKLLDAGVGFPVNGEHWIEQATIGLAAFGRGLRWRTMPYSHNFAITSRQRDLYNPAAFRAARVLHYHDAMQPHFWDELLARFRLEHPERYGWLAAHGPLQNPAPRLCRWASQALRAARSLPRRRYRHGALRAAAERAVAAPATAQASTLIAEGAAESNIVTGSLS